ncbi:MAG: hypothetical protein IMZ52_02345 [Actinobacteria bacterium]|nr:hypothetical protein [Actinomycetota bacterium]MBE3114863.1 hypothetical protein [Actinomycetota bacterium]
MRKIKDNNALRKGGIYYLINDTSSSTDRIMFTTNKQNKLILIKDLSDDRFWSERNHFKSFSILDEDKIYKLSEKELLARLI